MAYLIASLIASLIRCASLIASLIASLMASLIRCARGGRPQGRGRLLLRHLRRLLVQRQTGRRRGRRRHSDGGCPCACTHLDLRRPHSQARTPPAACFPPQLHGMHASAHHGGATWHRLFTLLFTPPLHTSSSHLLFTHPLHTSSLHPHLHTLLFTGATPSVRPRCSRTPC
jgi:hypothetical protein